MPKTTMTLRMLSILALAAALFTGCQKESSDGPVTIKVAYPVAVDAPVTDILNQYAEDYMAIHPEVTIETVYAGGYNDVKTMIQTTIDGGGDAPALSVLLATDLFDLANAQYLTSMSAHLDAMDGRDDYLGDFLPVFMENSYYMDEIWSLPFQRSAVVLYYNADMIAEAGLEVPTDWESLGETAGALTLREGNSVTRWGLDYSSDWPYWVFQPLAMGAGQNIVGAGDTEIYFDDEAVIRAIEYYNDLSAKYGAMPAGVQASWGSAVPDFVTGNRAMIVHSSGSLSSILAQADFNVGVMGVPGETEGTSFSVPGGGNIYMTAGLSEAEEKAAFDFAVFMTDAARAAEFSIATGYIATRTSCGENEELQAYRTEHPQVEEIQNILGTAGKEFAIQNLGEVRTIFHNYLQAAFNGQMDAAEAMKTAQEESDRALADFR